MKKKLIICCVVCLALGFFLGRWSTEVKEIIRYVEGKTIRDTITRFVPDTVYLAGELRYKYVYKRDTVYRDVPVVDRDETVKATVGDWNLIRDYKRILFDNNNGKLSVDLSVQYNELQRLSYSFTPVHEEATIIKQMVFVPFISASFYSNNSFSAGGGFFYYNLGFRAECSSNGLNFGVMYKF
ncbi:MULTISPECIES: hypothetical protein [Butyricimonas]|uniref:hypothetical protein n=1 Tax=Butyricimonas TaxID=574697 RepID=UPI0007FB2C53|nr:MULTISPECIES: hypothetical protein [Butyricimonas]